MYEAVPSIGCARSPKSSICKALCDQDLAPKASSVCVVQLEKLFN